MLVWSLSLHFTLGTQRGKSQMHHPYCPLWRGASQLATRRALKESASRWTNNSLNSFLGTKTTRESPNLAGAQEQFSSCGHICQEHPTTCTSALPSKGDMLPENKAGQSLAVQGTTVRQGCASWADGAWAQHPTCLCLQPQPGVYC